MCVYVFICAYVCVHMYVVQLYSIHTVCYRNWIVLSNILLAAVLWGHKKNGKHDKKQKITRSKDYQAYRVD